VYVWKPPLERSFSPDAEPDENQQPESFFVENRQYRNSLGLSRARQIRAILPGGDQVGFSVLSSCAAFRQPTGFPFRIICFFGYNMVFPQIEGTNLSRIIIVPESLRASGTARVELSSHGLKSCLAR